VAQNLALLYVQDVPSGRRGERRRFYRLLGVGHRPRMQVDCHRPRRNGAGRHVSRVLRDDVLRRCVLIRYRIAVMIVVYPLVLRERNSFGYYN
jgi:hypothetical protein